MENEKMESNNNNIKELKLNDLEEVSGGYSKIIDWPSLSKNRCDNCRKVIGGSLKGLQSYDGNHHLCEDCINDIKRMMPNGYENYIKKSFNIEMRPTGVNKPKIIRAPIEKSTPAKK